MTHNGVCPIWGTPASTFQTSRNGVDVDSPRSGGLYFVSSSAIPRLQSTEARQKSLLTTWLVDQRQHGVECPDITSHTLKEIAGRQPLSVQERADRLLKFVQKKALTIGKPFCFSLRYLNEELKSWRESETYSEMRAWSEANESLEALSVDNDEVIYLLDFLTKQGFLEQQVRMTGGINQGPHAGTENYFEYVITPSGHSRLADLQAVGTSSKQAFVAMWFDPSLSAVYETAIEPGIRDAGYEALRIDRKEHNNKIDDEIIAEIRRSRFLVADFTHGKQGMRGGVYYEAGFARGLGIEVISTCRQDVLDKNEIHFDTRQYSHIGWAADRLDEFRQAISNRISATIGDGPLRKSD